MSFHDKPILITGAARSGTSMTSGVVNLCGAWGGNVCGATAYNKRGQFENRPIVNEIVKPYLKSIDADPMGQNPLPEIDKLKPLPHLKDRMLSIIAGQGYKGQEWFYKGAKLCLMWPLFHDAFPDAKWIIVRRDKEDIINSCLKTAFMRAFKGRHGWSGWVDSHIERFVEMGQAGLNVTEVWPTRMVNGDFGEIKRTINELGLTWDDDAVKEFISKDLWSEGKDNA